MKYDRPSSLIVKSKFLKLTYFVEVEWEFAWNRTIKSSFKISGPVLRKNVFSSGILLAHTRYSGIDAFTAVYVFYGSFSEEKEYVFADVEGSDEIRL